MDWQSAFITLLATLLLGASVGLVMGFKAKTISNLDTVRDFLGSTAPELAQAPLVLTNDKRAALGQRLDDKQLFLVVLMGEHLTLKQGVCLYISKPYPGDGVRVFSPAEGWAMQLAFAPEKIAFLEQAC